MPAIATRIFEATVALLLLSGACGCRSAGVAAKAEQPTGEDRAVTARDGFEPRRKFDSSGFGIALKVVPKWTETTSLEEIAGLWKRLGPPEIQQMEEAIASPDTDPATAVSIRISQAQMFNYLGKPDKAYASLAKARALAEASPDVAARNLYTLIYFQGVSSLRLGENENCVDCRGASACILPIDRSAVHKKQQGSQQAIRHFDEYLERFPGDLEVRWLLNLAHMTLGQYPHEVAPQFLIPLDRFERSEFDIGKFKDVAHEVGLQRLNQSGGAIMDDFTGDGMPDVIVSSFDPQRPMGFFRNLGDGTFKEESARAGLLKQLGGLYCVQTDYDNDGLLDVFVPRGAWIPSPVRPSLLRNAGNGTFIDASKQAGFDSGLNSNSAQWDDIDRDGDLDVFICCERQPNKLYRNDGKGRFEEIAESFGLTDTPERICKGATWIDYDNDGYPDLFASYLDGKSHLFHNEAGSGFSEVSKSMGIDGPRMGFSCWSFDYDNDGWEDIFATSYDRTVEDIVKGLIGQPHGRSSNRLYRNVEGKRFEDVTKQSGLDFVFATMGSNFADLDNDGYLDMYLATGDPTLATLVPNRMLRNVDGKRFADISGTSGTGHLQKGHAVSCTDWDFDGDVDLFVQMGGAVPGDQYHNVLFQNPGNKNSWIRLKLVGTETNRAAIGARITVRTGGPASRIIRRTVTCGSSFGANALTQCIGLGPTEGFVTVEVRWPRSGQTDTYTEVATKRAYEIREGTAALKPVSIRPVRSSSPSS